MRTTTAVLQEAQPITDHLGSVHKTSIVIGKNIGAADSMYCHAAGYNCLSGSRGLLDPFSLERLFCVSGTTVFAPERYWITLIEEIERHIDYLIRTMHDRKQKALGR